MLRIKNINVKLDKFELSNISLNISKGEYFVLAGPSGSGKTILLEVLAGIYKIKNSGKITINGIDITNKKIQDRNLGLVFQDNTLFPHFSVKKNIEFALKQKNKKAESEKKLNDICKQLMLNDLLDRNPKTLSGGEIQRVLLARTLASNPKVLLLDEPLSGVDTHKKDILKRLLRELNRNGQTIIHVTHDFEEAFSLASKMGIMHNGKIVATGSPEDILRNPGNKFIARFCGYKNYFIARRASSEYFSVSDKLRLKFPIGNINNENFGVLIDETKIEIISEDEHAPKENIFKAVVKDIFNSVNGVEMLIDIGIELSIITQPKTPESIRFQIGDEITISIPKTGITIISG